MLCLPRSFFDDHQARALDTPEVLQENVRYVWVDAEDPHLPDLVDDAEYYADPFGPDDCPNIVKAAKRLLSALSDQEGA